VGEELPPHPLFVYWSRPIFEPAVTDKTVC
jgi:hypothetical protein